MTVSWGQFTEPFLDELRLYIGNRRVLETFAGNGLLASKLSALGVDIVATSLFAGHDGHESAMLYDVQEMSAAQAAYQYGDECDVLLMSWPTATEGATGAALAWGIDRPIIFIGEITDLSLGSMALGGCASDLFFSITEQKHTFGSYAPRNCLEHAVVFELDREKLDLQLDHPIISRYFNSETDLIHQKHMAP